MLVSFAREVGAPALAGKWTTTDPPINFVHIEFGEINRRGEAVGYHHRPDGVDPPEARVVRLEQKLVLVLQHCVRRPCLLPKWYCTSEG